MGLELEGMIRDCEKLAELQRKIRGLFSILECKGLKRKKEIARILGITEEQYVKALYYRDWLTRLLVRIENFKNARGRRPSVDFGLKELIERFGEKPKCYITGRELEWDWVSFDHIVPSSRGGSNDLENVGITTHFFNILKSDWPVDYLFEKMKQALEYQGYIVIPPKEKENQTLKSVMEKHFREKF